MGLRKFLWCYKIALSDENVKEAAERERDRRGVEE